MIFCPACGQEIDLDKTIKMKFKVTIPFDSETPTHYGFLNVILCGWCGCLFSNERNINYAPISDLSYCNS